MKASRSVDEETVATEDADLEHGLHNRQQQQKGQLEDEDDDASLYCQEVVLSSSVVPSTNDDDHTTNTKDNDSRQKPRRKWLAIVLMISCLLSVSLAFWFIRGDAANVRVDTEEDPDIDATTTPPPSPTTTTTDKEDTEFWWQEEEEEEEEGNSSTMATPGTNEEQQQQDEESSMDMRIPFPNAQLPNVWDTSSSYVYNSVQDLDRDLTTAAKLYINHMVWNQLGRDSSSSNGSSISTPWNNGHDSTNTWRNTNQNNDLTGAEESNPQQAEEPAGIRKANRIQVDQTSGFVYAAYNHHVLFWDAQGTQVAQLDVSGSNDNNGNNNNKQSSGIFANNMESSGMFMGSNLPAAPTTSGPHIEALLLIESSNTLMVLVSSPLSPSTSSQSSSSGPTTEPQPILTESLEVQTYSVASLVATAATMNPQWTLLQTQTLSGRFVDARYVQDAAQVLITTTTTTTSSSSGLNANAHLGAPLARYSPAYADLTDEQYIQQVRQDASQVYIPAFVKQLRQELILAGTTSSTTTTPDDDNDDDMPIQLLQIRQWQTSSSPTTTASIDATVLNSVTFVTSLDMTSSSSNNDNTPYTMSTNVMFSPSPWMQVYHPDDGSRLILAPRAWGWSNNTQGMEEVTHLIVLGVIARSTTLRFHSMATVRGTVLNSHALSMVNDELRIATTITHPRAFQPRVEENGDINNNNNGDQHSYMLQDRTAYRQETVTENYLTSWDMSNDNNNNDVFLRQPRVHVLLGDNNKSEESIKAVRFLETMAYIMTTETLYVVDSNNRQIVGTLPHDNRIQFNYLVPLHGSNNNSDHTLLLGLGQSMTTNAADLTIGLFNVTDPTQPYMMVQYTVGDSQTSSSESASTTTTTESWSSSVAQWDYQAFQYRNGYLVVPLESATYRYEQISSAVHQTLLDTFEGFVVFAVTPSQIREHLRISHGLPAGQCHACGYLAPRSWISYNDDDDINDPLLMTAQGNVVTSTLLDSAQEQWAFQVEVEGEPASCCY